ncbi:MAG TPA: heme peroxidase family protein, partial [Candidatus Binataceae bacterium]|nr:heme peroxidase family protein [Candidatus Binataceae bacterium]
DQQDARSNNNQIPAGFTYLGQFIDHDLTFDPSSKLERENDPDSLEDFRTPRFDLDSLYGKGPDDSPYMYSDSAHFEIGTDSQGNEDLPRNGGTPERALIGDPRNDENLIVSQLHLAFLKFHNRVVDELLGRDNRFERAREVVRRHYQWIVLHEFLPHIVGQEVVQDILRQDVYSIGGVQTGTRWKAELKFFRWKVRPFMPVEFSVAAYRFGHSMVRFNYALNEMTASPNELLIFDPKHPEDPNATDLRGFRARPKDRVIDWFRFFATVGQENDLQVSRGIDTQISSGLGGLPNIVVGSPPNSLAVRNLLRGVALGLPSGQDVARAMGIPEELIVSSDNRQYPFSIGTGFKLPGGKDDDPSVPKIAPDRAKQLEAAFGRQTPLWYYILKEAELICDGKRLGPVGGRIVAEVFVGLMLGDKTSFLNVEPNWRPRKPCFGCRTDGVYTITDLLTYALRSSS